MYVVFRAYGPARDVIGAKAVDCELPADATVEELLSRLTDEYPELAEWVYDDGSLSSIVSLTVNGTNVSQREGVETPLSAGDEVRVAPPIHGG
jgi:MoaD family protein, archaeal